MAERVRSRVFVRHCRYDGFRQIVSNGLVGHRMPVVAAIAFGALSELWIRLSRMAGTRNHPCGNERRIIEAVLRSQPELILQRQRRQLRVGGYTPAIGKYPKNTLGLFSFVISFGRIC